MILTMYKNSTLLRGGLRKIIQGVEMAEMARATYSEAAGQHVCHIPGVFHLEKHAS